MHKPEVVFEDDTVMVLNKPAGWVVNDAKTAHGNPIIQNWIRDNFNFSLSQDMVYRSGVVHRLDKDTSGLLLIAKTEAAFINLTNQFKTRKIRKSYSALVHGRVKNVSGEIVENVGRLPWNRERFGVLPSGRYAETFYKLETVYKDNKGNFYSLLNINPRTGRTHQIRIHLKHIGHPIVSDGFYAGRKTSRKDKLWCERLFLHAGEIEFLHPIKEKLMTFLCPLTEDLKQSLGTLTKVES